MSSTSYATFVDTVPLVSFQYPTLHHLSSPSSTMTQLHHNHKRRRTYTFEQQRDLRERRLRYCRGGATARLPTTVNVNGGDSTSSHQSAGLSSASPLLLSRYSNLSSDVTNRDDQLIAVIDSFKKCEQSQR